MDFRSFCERVAKSTTFNRQEVEAVLNYTTEIARDIVEFGDLGTLSPSFKSKVVPVGEVFNVQKHIEKLPKTIDAVQIEEVKGRLKALDAMKSRVPLPKGPLPTSMKGSRKAMRGR